MLRSLLLTFYCTYVRYILYAWDTEEIKGWYLGRVTEGAEKLTSSERKALPGMCYMCVVCSKADDQCV